MFEIDFALNVEYFFTELPQLGFNAGLSGLALSFNDGDTSFALGSPITFGIRYYFN